MQTSPLPHQIAVFEKLVELGTSCLKSESRSLPIRPRFNSLIVGPSGSGKTFIASSVAKALSVPFLTVTVADWVLLSCRERGGKITWHLIIDFLYRHRSSDGVLIFVDEIQHACGDCPWERFLRVELFSLLDQRFPSGIQVEVLDEDGDDFTLKEKDLEQLQTMLQQKAFIIGAGAFQEIWERETSRIGFREEMQMDTQPTLRNLTSTLPTEVINRFRSDLLILQPLRIVDYEAMLEDTAKKLPLHLRGHFLRIGKERLPEVCRLRQGSRFLEELMTDVLIFEERRNALIEKPVPKPVHFRNPWGSRRVLNPS